MGLTDDQTFSAAVLQHVKPKGYGDQQYWLPLPKIHSVGQTATETKVESDGFGDAKQSGVTAQTIRSNCSNKP